MQCFNLREPRNGEICNACVLLVKRYKRLPVGSKRHWGHVSNAQTHTRKVEKEREREQLDRMSLIKSFYFSLTLLPERVKVMGESKVLDHSQKLIHMQLTNLFFLFLSSSCTGG